MKINNSYKHLILTLFFLLNIFISDVNANENYVVSTVNNIPITKFDIVNRAKLIAFAVDQDLEFKNLQNFYNQSFNSLTNERIIESAGLKLNKNINKIVSKKAYELTLQDFDNSEDKLDQYVKKLSIPKLTIYNKFKTQLIWVSVLKDRFKLELKNLEEQSEEIIKRQEAQRKQDLFDVAEIVLEKKGNSQLLKNINLALKQGSNFLNIAKQVSISTSAKFNGKIGWMNYQNLPNYIKDKKIDVKEGDIISFPLKDKVKIIKILVKRNEGKLSEIENKVLLAQINFPINFQQKIKAYKNVKKTLSKLLENKINCDELKKINNRNNNSLKLKIVNSRIADLSPNIQKVIKNRKLEISNPIYIGNNGYTFIVCDKIEAKISNNNLTKLKKDIVEKQFLIFSEKLIKKLNKQANIIDIEKIN
jgi:peptidyl-prolyl cis-trans isomerase SurA